MGHHKSQPPVLYKNNSLEVARNKWSGVTDSHSPVKLDT